MSIIIFGDSFSFPEGLASTNRVHTYAKGFFENGVNVHVICFRSQYNNGGDGVTNGINFYHPFGNRERSNSLLIRSWHKLLRYFKAAQLVRKINRKDGVIAVITYSVLFRTHLFAWYLTKLSNSKLLKECGEHPLRLHQEGSLRKKIGVVKFKIESNLSDGIICISQYLIDFHKYYGIPSYKLVHVPSTVDTGRFLQNNNQPLKFDYILYCGSLTLSKDGVNILVESFTRISEKHPEVRLVLIGKGDTIEEETYIRELVESLDITGKVFFLGQLSRNEIPRYMNHSKILALARPESMVADAGFPSKLTEYLATGVPVVVTEVGEIPVYLKDRENAFLSKPGNVEAFANKLDFVLNNYQFARNVASKGKLLTDTVFNYNFQAARIIDYVERYNSNL
jgi:glycosyltransferase involved in cell wall biosynthesis